MQAHQLATPYPTVRMDTDGLSAARLMTEQNRPALIVVDDHDHPIAILPGSQVLRMLIPRYVQDDPTLARVLDEKFADSMGDSLRDKTVQDLMPRQRTTLPVVAPDDTMLEIAAIMASSHSPLVAVVEERSKTAPLLGAISASQVLGVVLPAD